MKEQDWLRFRIYLAVETVILMAKFLPFQDLWRGKPLFLPHPAAFPAQFDSEIRACPPILPIGAKGFGPCWN
jgi:hypothetical protein